MITSQTPESVPVLVLPPAVLGIEQTRALRDEFADRIFLDTEEEYGLETALVRLAPTFGRRRRPGGVARTTRRIAGDLREVAGAVAAAIVTAVALAVIGPLALVSLGPFLYELGV